MFDNDLTQDELKKVLQEYRNKMLEETKKKEEMKKKIDDYFLKFENNADYMGGIQKLYNHGVNPLTSKEPHPLKLDMYEKYICSSFGHDPERTYNGDIKVENGLCKCKLCGKTYTLEKNTEKTK